MSLVDELAKLHDLQKIDTQIYQREKAIAALDSGESLKQAAIAILKAHDDATTRLKKLQADLLNHELELKAVEAKKAAVHEKLYSGRVNNPKELGDLQAEEEMFQQQIHTLEGPLIELMDQVEMATAKEAELAQQLAAAKRSWKETVARTQAETARLQQEIATIRPDRDAAAAPVEKLYLRRYDEIRKRREGIGLAVTGNDSCPICHVKLTARIMESLREGEELTLCENCDRILLYQR